MARFRARDAHDRPKSLLPRAARRRTTLDHGGRVSRSHAHRSWTASSALGPRRRRGAHRAGHRGSQSIQRRRPSRRHPRQYRRRRATKRGYPQNFANASSTSSFASSITGKIRSGACESRESGSTSPGRSSSPMGEPSNVKRDRAVAARGSSCAFPFVAARTIRWSQNLRVEPSRSRRSHLPGPGPPCPHRR
jgi:hypothetical protein